MLVSPKKQVDSQKPEKQEIDYDKIENPFETKCLLGKSFYKEKKAEVVPDVLKSAKYYDFKQKDMKRNESVPTLPKNEFDPYLLKVNLKEKRRLEQKTPSKFEFEIRSPKSNQS